MSDNTELDVYFKTSNPNAHQELSGIFHNSWDMARVSPKPGHPNMFEVRILELSLLECDRIFKEVYAHCAKNNREIQIVVTYGAVHRVFM